MATNISLEDLKNDAALPTDELIKSDAEEVINREYTPKEQKTEEDEKAVVGFRKMNIGSNPQPVERSEFKSKTPEVDPEAQKLLDDIDFATDRITARVNRAAQEAEDELKRQINEGIESGLIVPVSETKNNQVKSSQDNDEDDPYEDDDAEDLIIDNKENNTSALDIITQRENEVIKMENDAANMTDDQFEALIGDANNILRNHNSAAEDVELSPSPMNTGNVETVELSPSPVDDETTEVLETNDSDEEVENSTKELPMTNPAVDFDDEDDDPYEDEDDDSEDLDDDVSDDSDEDAEEDKKIVEEFRNEVKTKLKPVRNSIDLSRFSIRKKPVKASSIIKIQKASVNVSDWVLPTLGRPISVSELSGMEIIKMNPEESGRNRIDTAREMYRIIYEHVEDPNKGSYEEWCQTIPFSDVSHLQFALYKATFEHSNFIHCSCENCKKISLQQIPLMDMVNFENDEAKDRFNKMYEKESVSPIEGYELTMVQITDKYVFGLKLPSIYNVIIEIASLTPAFINKYNDLVDIISYIDSIYYIDEENEELLPISTNPVKGDIQKSCMRKIRIFNDILNNLSSDEYLTLRTKITELGNSSSDISYKIPDTTCPSCNETIEGENNVEPDRLLFTRHQLGLISNS